MEAPAQNHRHWRFFFGLVRLFAMSAERGRAAFWVGSLVGLLLLVNGLNVLNSYVGRDFMSSIQERRYAPFVRFGMIYAGIFALTSVVTAVNRFCEERLRLLWREWLTRRLLDRYLGHFAYYRMAADHEDVGNVDQRITEDVKSFSQMTLTLALLYLNATLTAVAFLGVLWSISPWAVLVAVLYAAGGSLVTVLLGRPLVGLNNTQLDNEAAFRHELVRLHDDAEAVALARAEAPAAARLRDRLGAVLGNNRRIIAVTRNLVSFTNYYNYMIQVVPVLMAAPKFIRGEVDFGVIAQAQVAFAQVLGALSVFITQFESISTFAAVVGRLERVSTAIDASAAPPAPGVGAVEVVQAGDRIAFEHLTLRERAEVGGRTLIVDLSAAVAEGRRLAVTGHNGRARDALFRAAAGIWLEGEGRVLWPAGGGVEFLNPHPLTTVGSLREQLRADGHDAPTDDQALAVLRPLHFQSALDRLGGLDAENDWREALSHGEQRLLAVARVLLHRPRFAVLDRVTEDLSHDDAELVYKLLDESGIGYISLVENPDLCRFHDANLDIHDDGTWTYHPDAAPAPSA